MNVNQPMNHIYVLVDGTIKRETARQFEFVLSDLTGKRRWLVAPPELIDYIDEESDGDKHTYGCVLRVCSALPPWGTKLSREADRLHYEETKLLIDSISQFSATHQVDFYVQFDKEVVGTIHAGIPSKGICIGLLDEWRKNVEHQGPSMSL